MGGEEARLAIDRAPKNSGSLVKTGFVFSGWNTAAGGTGTDYAEGESYTADAALTLYAKWTAPPTSYSTWATGTFANTLTDTSSTSNPDGDSMNNMMEFAFGTDPTLSDGGSLVVDGSAHGGPLLMKGAGDQFELVFVRRVDHGASGSVSYTVQFSNDLATFEDSVVAPTFVVDSSVNSDYEVVKVPYPASARFGRIGVTSVP